MEIVFLQMIGIQSDMPHKHFFYFTFYSRFESFLKCFSEKDLLNVYETRENFSKVRILQKEFFLDYCLQIRNIVVAQIYRIRESCGYGVPLMQYIEDRRFSDWKLAFFNKIYFVLKHCKR